MTDTPEPDMRARMLAERAYSAYAQQAQGPLEPVAEQTLLARLAEALRPAIDESPQKLADAANAAFDAWEAAGSPIRGPRLARADAAAGTVTLRSI